ncbi:lon-related putative ATP-dependent protease [Marinospirillum celere]|uniref:endopeptidase La n=1 Tax=Marinospirillum celere TaxID=1122252 RepID=A0A1I1EBY8_9GAMM|nr:ATP-binding protein [Marinospirillum celere]SFB84256.1 lon-related putative ATP-dependent protease [Marinospirillum celere]
MRTPKSLPLSKLYKACRAKDFNFEDTRQIPPLDTFIGQQRAEEALQFGTAVNRKGYNIFAVGHAGLGKRTMIRRFLEKRAEQMEPPSDWLYLHDFANSRKPWAVRLPCGLGKVFKEDLQELLLDLKQAIPAAFDNEGFFERAEKIKDHFADQQSTALKALSQEGGELGLKLILQTPGGYSFVPADEEDQPMDAGEFAKLDDATRKDFREKIEDMEKKLRLSLRALAQLEKESRQEQLRLNEEVTDDAIQEGLQVLKDKYLDYPRIQQYLEALYQDIQDNVTIFLEDEDDESEAVASVSPDKRIPTRYQVNLLVSHADREMAPVIEEALPTHNNIVGHVENVTYQGTVATDFSLIRPGALHRANGGFLVLDAERLLSQPYAWEGLKLALRTGSLRIDTLERQLSLSGSVSLEPEPIPLDCTVALLGDYELLHALQEQDSEFVELFKVVAEFETEMPRTSPNQKLYARLIASMASREALLPFAPSAVMRIVEEAARMAEHQDKLSLNAADLNHLLREADYIATRELLPKVEAEHIREALASRRRRAGRYPEHVLESIRDDFIMISTSGNKIGQVNGLTVVGSHDFLHGQPSRITARVHYGHGEVLDIERSVHMGGSMHSKGVMILTGYLCGLFGAEDSLPLDASIVFEQSYGGVDGDSASLGELICLFSAMAEVPVAQNLAVTGSINQLGEVQPIGGVNEKIEGFFEVCQARGLTGDQGVIIPKQNTAQLMLREEVREAVEAGQFNIWAVSQVEEAIQLMLGIPAGKLSSTGKWPKNTLYGKIAARLDRLREKDSDSKESDKAGSST